jgi:hypothetical protein
MFNKLSALLSSISTLAILASSITQAQTPQASILPVANTKTVKVLQPGGPSGGVRDNTPLRDITRHANTYNAETISICNNAAGDGELIQAALNMGYRTRLVGQCHLDSNIMVGTAQEFYGEDRTAAVLNVSTVLTTGAVIFAATAAGLAGEAGPNMHDIGISFAQNNATTRAGLIAFTPAIYAEGSSRWRLHNVRITNAMIGVDARNDGGGFTIDNLEVSCMEVCIWDDGAADTQDISHIHIWPFGILGTNCGQAASAATGECQLYARGNYGCGPEGASGSHGPIGILTGRADDFRLSHSLILIGQSLCVQASTAEPIQGTTFGSVTDVGFDTYNGIAISAGQLTVANSYFTQISNGNYAVSQSGGSLQLSNIREAQGNGGGLSPFTLLGGSLMISNLYADMNAADVPVVSASQPATLQINGLQISTAPGLTFNEPKIQINAAVAGVNAIITGVQPLTAIASGTLIDIRADGYHRVIGNGLQAGWVNSCPPAIHAVYANNGSSTAAACN